MFFDPEFLSSVMLKAVSGIGGAGVTGGVASFRTLQVEDILKPDADLGMRLRASTGIGKWANGSDPSGSIALARRGETLDLLLAYSQKNSGAYEPGSKGKAFNIPFATLPLNVVSLTDQDQESLMMKGRWKITPRQNLQLTAIGTRADYAESSMQDLDGASAVRHVYPIPLPTPCHQDCVEFAQPRSRSGLSRFPAGPPQQAMASTTTGRHSITRGSISQPSSMYVVVPTALSAGEYHRSLLTRPV